MTDTVVEMNTDLNLDPSEITAETICPNCRTAGHVYAKGYLTVPKLFREDGSGSEDGKEDPHDMSGGMDEDLGWRCLACGAGEYPGPGY